MKFILIAIVSIGLFTACKNTNNSNTVVENKDTTSGSFMPVPDFLKEDLRKVDSFSGGIVLKTLRDEKKDSVYISIDDLKERSKAFMSEELDSAVFNREFTETSIMDETTSLLNFIYIAKPGSPSTVRKVVVYIAPSLATDKINRIYIEREFSRGDTVVSQKMTWKLRQYWMLAEEGSVPGKATYRSVQKAIWDPTMFAE